VATLLLERKEELARAATSEMGKLIVESEAEVEKCAWVCEYYAEHAARFLADEPKPSTATESYVAYRPLGLLPAIMPWNFPLLAGVPRRLLR
jgi:succinate-semialdehyde dehydrogenase/glutarate-semialdehyde dehydrogenase